MKPFGRAELCGALLMTMVAAAVVHYLLRCPDPAPIRDTNVLRSLGLALHHYHAKHGSFPPAFLPDSEGRPMHSWRVLLLPYVEEQGLFDAYRFDEPWDGPNNRALADKMPNCYCFSAENRKGNTITNFVAVIGKETIWPGATTVSLDQNANGGGKTILLVENKGMEICWLEPRDLSIDDMSLAIGDSTSVSGPNREPFAVFGDGSVRRLGLMTTPEALKALLTIRGSERVQEDATGAWRLALP